MTSAAPPAGTKQGKQPPTQKEMDEIMAEYEKFQQQMQMEQQQQPVQSWPEMLVNISLYGGISFVRHAIGNPAQRVTVLLNTEAELVRQGILLQPLGGIIPAIKHLLVTEGIFAGLFRGTLSDALMLVPVRILEDIASSITSGVLQQLFGEAIMGWSQPKLLVVSIGASAAAMLVCVPVSYPREAIVTRMHADVRPEMTATTPFRYSGPIDTFKSFATFRKLFSGALVGVVNLVVYRSAFYLSLNGLLAVSNGRARKLITIACTAFACFVHHPLDVIRQRLIVSGDGPKPHASPVACAEHIVKKEGYKGLYRGLKFRLLVTALNVAFVEIVGLMQA